MGSGGQEVREIWLSREGAIPLPLSMTRISTRLPLRTALTRSESGASLPGVGYEVVDGPRQHCCWQAAEIGLRGLQMQGAALLLAEGFGTRPAASASKPCTERGATTWLSPLRANSRMSI